MRTTNKFQPTNSRKDLEISEREKSKICEKKCRNFDFNLRYFLEKCGNFCVLNVVNLQDFFFCLISRIWNFLRSKSELLKLGKVFKNFDFMSSKMSEYFLENI